MYKILIVSICVMASSFCTLSYASVTSKTMFFDVSTVINKAMLSSYSIETIISRENIALIYDSNNQTFRDENILIMNKSNILNTESDNYQYGYHITNLVSSCQLTSNDESVIVKDFARLFINDVEYNNEDKTPNMDFDSVSEQGFLTRTDTLSIRTDDESIPRGRPAACSGLIELKVQLIL